MQSYRTLIAKHIGFPLQDFVRKTSIIKTYDFLKVSQYWSDEQMYDYRLNKLQRLVRFAYNNVPYYFDLFCNHGILPEDIKSLDDIKKIPILTKEIARSNQKKLLATNFNLNLVQKGKTGGTTGVPLITFSDTNNRSFAWASYYRWYNWIGIGMEERVLTLWGSKTVLKPSLKSKFFSKSIDWIQNKKTINTFNINDNNIQEVYDEIIRFNPVLIKGYLSAIILLAKHMQSHNLAPNKALRALSSTTETLLPMYRNLLQTIFSVPIYDQYGCGEISAISYECAENNGLHINEEHVIVETIVNSPTYVSGNNERLIITSLDNYIMPFIRYENGDLAKLHNQKCTCGINSQIMSHIEGRTTDTITLKNGAKVHGVFFTDILYEIGITTDIISRFQIFQYKSGNIDFKIESNNNISKELINRLESELTRFVNKVNVLIVEHIPSENTGKFKYIKNEL